MILDLTKPEHAYFYGFICCDGSLFDDNRHYKLSIEIAKKDKDLLEKFQQLFPQAKISDRIRKTNFLNAFESSVFVIYSKEFIKELEKLGLPVGKKSLTIAPPNVPFSEIDFMRGLVDGDGAVGFLKTNNKPFVAFTTASESIKDFYINFLEKNQISNRKTSTRNKRDGLFGINVFNKLAQNFVNVVYYDGCISLNRKQVEADKIKRLNLPNVKVVQRWNSKEDEYILSHSDEDAAKFLNRTLQSVKTRRWRLNKK